MGLTDRVYMGLHTPPVRMTKQFMKPAVQQCVFFVGTDGVKSIGPSVHVP